jgi:crotonobetainyl-CoA:carnitine CoA-transferase CaiB-like acyl-CoA transferase
MVVLEGGAVRTDEVVGAPGAGAEKPLAGVRILAPEQMQALPFATQLLAHLGADVVKVEHPSTGESGRGAKPAVRDEDGREVGATYLRNNLSKRSVTIDLKHPEGRELFKALVPRFDVVAENFKPGTMDRLGLGYRDLSTLHPPLVYVSVSGFGNLVESPYSAWPAYAPIVEAMAGFYEATRPPGQPPRVGVAGALGDIGSALFAAIGTLAALRHRDRTGVGQHVDVAMFDAMVAMADMVPFMWSMAVRREPGATGSRSGAGIIEGFAAKDGYFVVEVVREHQFTRFAEAVGHPEWVGDPRFSTRRGWVDHLEEVIRPAVESWASTRTKLEACHELCAAGVAAGPSNTPGDVVADPHVRLRHMLIEVPRPDAEDPLLVVGNPVKLSGTAEGPVRRWPRLGEHTDQVLAEELGLSGAELERLRANGVI